jgi:chromosomal replication initiation ATPase DnaA
MQFERVATRHNPQTAAEVFAAAHSTRARIQQREAEAQARRIAARKAVMMAEQERKREAEESARRLVQRYRLAVDIPARISGDASKTCRIEDVIGAVCNHFNVSKTDMLSSRRDKAIVMPRQVAMYVARTFTLRSLPEIGRRFGSRDHTTVIHAVGKLTALLEAGDERAASDIAAIKQALGVS